MPSAIEEYPFDGQARALAEIVGGARPLVLRGLCRDWPIVALARRSDSDFAKGLATFDNGTPVDTLLMPPGEHGVIGYNTELDGFNYKHFRVTVTQVLERLASYSRQQDTPGVAMQSALVSACLPGLVEQLVVPFLDCGIQPRLWMGNQVTTPAHFDSSCNIAVVACGRRRFTLFPPAQVRNLYVGPLDFAPTAAAISVARLDQAGDPRFPRLHEALAHAQVAELEPGDAIYIPPLWWHHVASLERLNALVNYWWRSAPSIGPAAEPGLDALMHCLLAFKALPSAEREAWKTLLDHYVFNEEDPAAHIPPARRGILGTLTPELIARMKETIRRSL